MTTNSQKDKTIKLATYNIFLFSNPQIIAQNILTMEKKGIEVFCLQEVLKAKEKPFIGDAIVKLLGDQWDIEYNLGTESTNISHGVAILWSKRKLHKVGAKKIILPTLTKLSFINKLIRYIARFKDIKIENKALSLDFSIGGKNVRISSVHIGLSAGNLQHRLKQHEVLVKNLENKTMPYEIICGDFNSLRGKTYNNEMQYIKKLYGKDFIETCSKISWTQDLHYSKFEKTLVNLFIKYTNLHYRQNLDHILIKGFTSSECERLALEGSDHFPLATTLAFN